MLMKYTFGRTTFSCLALLSLVACNDEENALLETTAGKLAAIDAGTTRISQSQLWPYETLLTSLQAKCGQTEIGVSDTAVHASNIFQSAKGIEVSALTVMQMIDDAIPDGTQLNCDEVVAAIITLS